MIRGRFPRGSTLSTRTCPPIVLNGVIVGFSEKSIGLEAFLSLEKLSELVSLLLREVLRVSLEAAESGEMIKLPDPPETEVKADSELWRCGSGGDIMGVGIC